MTKQQVTVRVHALGWLALLKISIASSVLFLFVTSVHAQSSGPPTYSVGDTWTRKVGDQMRESKVVKIDDGGTWFTGGRLDCPTCLSYVDQNLTLLRLTDADGKDVDVTNMRFIPIGAAWRLFDFPLEVNKVWQISAQAFFRGTPYRYEIDCRVVSYEDVGTPAGTFKAFRVRRDWTYRSIHGGGYDVRWTDESWFAPDVKNVVKFTSSGRGVEQSELVSYGLK